MRERPGADIRAAEQADTAETSGFRRAAISMIARRTRVRRPSRSGAFPGLETYSEAAEGACPARPEGVG